MTGPAGCLAVEVGGDPRMGTITATCFSCRRRWPGPGGHRHPGGGGNDPDAPGHISGPGVLPPEAAVDPTSFPDLASTSCAALAPSRWRQWRLHVEHIEPPDGSRDRFPRRRRNRRRESSPDWLRPHHHPTSVEPDVGVRSSHQLLQPRVDTDLHDQGVRRGYLPIAGVDPSSVTPWCRKPVLAGDPSSLALHTVLSGVVRSGGGTTTRRPTP